MNIVIVGASGYLGSHLMRALSHDPRLSITGTYYRRSTREARYRLNIKDAREVETFFRRNHPDLVIWLAAIKDVRACQTDARAAYALNVQPLPFALAAIQASNPSTKLLYVSSDYVFDGKRGSYRANDKRNPTTIYGQSKKIAEDLIMKSTVSYTIVRTAAVIGPDSAFVRWILSPKKRSIALYDDLFNTPTPLQLFLDGMRSIVWDFDRWGKKVHLVGSRRMSRYELGATIIHASGSKNRTVPVHVAKDSYLPRDLSLAATSSVYGTDSSSFLSELTASLSMSHDGKPSFLTGRRAG